MSLSRYQLLCMSSSIGWVSPVPSAFATTHTPQALWATCVPLGAQADDAAHAATAARLGVRSMITIDTGFAATSASELELYVASRQVSRCRGLRAGGR